MSKKSIIIILFSVLSVMVAQISKAAVIHVTTMHDNVPGSLRAAITTANNNGEDNTIYLPVGAYILSGAADEDGNVSGDLDIYTGHNLTITGARKSQTFIDGNGIDRVLHVFTGTVTITDLTIRKGNTGYGRKENGGGIANGGNLILIRCIIKENKASEGNYGGLWFSGDDGGHGGGIYNYGTLTLNKCIVMGNRAGNGGDSGMRDGGNGGHGGAIDNSGTLFLNNCNITSNRSGSGGFGDRYDGYGGDGGGIYNSGNLTMLGCTVNGNISCQEENDWNCGCGGGIFNLGDISLINCTISGNRTGTEHFGGANGGGLYNSGNSQLIGVTVVNNTAGGIGDFYLEGGGIYNDGIISLKNSIIANNRVSSSFGFGSDCYGTFNWVCCSLIADTNDCTLTGFQKANILGQDPLLGPLADNGGPTKTHALLPGSPAIDAGNSSGLYTDQRGYKRPINIIGIPNVSDGADIGAYEYIVPYSTADSR